MFEGVEFSASTAKLGNMKEKASARDFNYEPSTEAKVQDHSR